MCIRDRLNSLFFDPKRYDLAKVGRYKYNKKLGISNRINGVTVAEDVINPETGEIMAEKGQKIGRDPVSYTHLDVVIDEEKILSRTEPGEIKNFNGRIIDVAGNTLLPGFFDLHAHLYLSGLNLLLIDNKSTVETVFDTYAFSREYLRQGYTTIRDAGCRDNVTRGLMAARRKGIINTPDIISSGQIITPTENGNDEYKTLYAVAAVSYTHLKIRRAMPDTVLSEITGLALI